MNPSKTMRETGERECIRRLAALTGTRPDVAVGIGDDCAVVSVEGSPWDWVLTSDPVIEGVHYLPGTEGRRVGNKAAGRVLSDIAAMGAEPLWLLVNLVASPDTPMDWIEDAYRGLTAAVARHGAAVIGGDVARGDRVEFHVFGVGRVPRGTALRRGGARPGDLLYVTGDLGGSILGKHLDFEPRLAGGAWLRAGGWATAAMDVSDGLASDLRRLMEESRVGVEIEAARIPVSRAAAEAADGRSAFEHAMGDGEDFELLFAVSAEKSAALESEWETAFPLLACTRIGRVTSDVGRLIVLAPDGRRVDLAAGGYEHFRS